jgi:drug/metabolite transporter (DMT)-like permease
MEIWIAYTLLAAFMQSIRTAGQKRLSQYLSPMATTLVRYLYGVPFVVCYLVIVAQDTTPAVILHTLNSWRFLVFASLASVAQVLATVWLVKIFSFRNFAVATIFAKTEAIQTAILGTLIFGASLSVVGWIAVLLGAVGIVFLSLTNDSQSMALKSVGFGMLSGLAFAFTALWLREASLSLSLSFSFVVSAAITLAYMVMLQTALCLGYVFIKEREQFKVMMKHFPLALFVGATSAVGSMGWYTAMTYENAALVKSLGQIELVFSLLISYLFFKEKTSSRELLGMAAIVASVLVLLLVH